MPPYLYLLKSTFNHDISEHSAIFYKLRICNPTIPKCEVKGRIGRMSSYQSINPSCKYETKPIVWVVLLHHHLQFIEAHKPRARIAKPNKLRKILVKPRAMDPASLLQTARVNPALNLLAWICNPFVIQKSRDWIQWTLLIN